MSRSNVSVSIDPSMACEVITPTPLPPKGHNLYELIKGVLQTLAKLLFGVDKSFFDRDCVPMHTTPTGQATPTGEEEYLKTPNIDRFLRGETGICPNNFGKELNQIFCEGEFTIREFIEDLKKTYPDHSQIPEKLQDALKLFSTQIYEIYLILDLENYFLEGEV